MKHLKVTFGILFCLVGCLGILISSLSILDPVSAQFADDNNPFGKPPSLLRLCVSLVISLVLAGTGILLIKKKEKSGS
jgi:hypothetical protein